ncbi:MAG: sigma-54 dependent transcriptional regulator [Deltaproteobacteria bacterium]|nr:sigma-54 dependent transcriptional regulator [Deltaproteobacteria bacterium]
MDRHVVEVDAAPEPRSEALRVLLIDDDLLLGQTFRRAFARDNVHLEPVGHPDAGIAAARDADLPWDAIILDFNLPGCDGLRALELIRQAGVTTSVVMLSADNSAATAAACLRAGAFHYLTKPIRHVELLAVIESAARFSDLQQRVRMLEHQAAQAAYGHLLVGDSVAMRAVKASLERLAHSSVSVLVLGESGTGKELIARALHDSGPRRGKPFVAVNCGAIPDTLIDSELFGHSRGAFTGADNARPGMIVEADRGTLFLDEIGDMPLAVQGRLLRVLQEGEVRPVGGEHVRKVDVRVVAATNVDLQKAVEEKRFREDLFYRLNVVTLPLPPLRARREDLPMLAAFFLRKHGRQPTPKLTARALERLVDHTWPGNVREFENAILHALALGRGELLDTDVLPPRIRTPDGAMRVSDQLPRLAEASGEITPPPPPTLSVAAIDPIDELPLVEAKRKAQLEFEKRYLERALERANGSVAEASRHAGLDRANFRKILQRNGLDPTRYRP